MFMDSYKKWTLITSANLVVLWLVFYFAFYVPANDIIFYWTILHVTMMLFYIPLTYGLECFIKEQFLKRYTSRYIQLHAIVDVIFSFLFLFILLIVIVLSGTKIEYSNLLWMILLSSMLLSIIFGILEAKRDL